MKNLTILLACIIAPFVGHAALVDTEFPEGGAGEGYVVEIEASGSYITDSGDKFEKMDAFIKRARNNAKNRMFPRLVLAAKDPVPPKAASALVNAIVALRKEKIPYSIVFVENDSKNEK